MDLAVLQLTTAAWLPTADRLLSAVMLVLSVIFVVGGAIMIAVRPKWNPVRRNGHGWRPGPGETGFCGILLGGAVLIAAGSRLAGVPPAVGLRNWLIAVPLAIAAVAVALSWAVRGRPSNDE